MAFFTDLDRRLTVLRSVVGADVESAGLPERVVGACNDDVMAIISEATAAIGALEALRITAAGVASARSRRVQGHEGLAAGEGHKNATSLIQTLTGTTKAEAGRQVKLGKSLLEGANLRGGVGGVGGPDAEGGPGADGEPGADASAAETLPVREPWHAGLGRAQLSGELSPAQHHAILRGLGEPPATGDVAVDAEFAEAWTLAAEQLTAEALNRTVEELVAAARTIRDRLDPQGAEDRFLKRFEGRSFRMWTDADGVRHGKIVFDDETGAWLASVLDSALRPRRGGPRFVDPAEKKRAEELIADPRTNDQLSFDLISDILRAGTLADPKAVFGTRQAGLRVVVSAKALADAAEGIPAVAHTEDGLHPLPAWLAAQRACESGTHTIYVSDDGEPLKLGREERLYTAAQRRVIAGRDGGCIIPDCTCPPSLCEVHHIDEFAKGGCTDVDRGVLLCRFHHMNLHNRGGRITRDGLGPFVYHPPPGQGDPIVLQPRLALTYLWAELTPPAKRFLPVAA